ncbi:hypothetical protein GY45DRAFT_614676, partial [Cubamyces sp. BRFM 1775]
MHCGTEASRKSQEAHSSFFAENLRSRTQFVPTDLWLEAVLELDGDTRSRFGQFVNEERWQSDPDVVESLRKIQSAQGESEGDALDTLTTQVLERFQAVGPSCIFNSPIPCTAKTELVLPRATPSSPAESSPSALIHARVQRKRSAHTSQDDQGPSKRPRVASHLRDADLEHRLQELFRAPLEMRYANGTRLSCVLWTLCQTTVTFWYIDPCGIVVSDPGLCLLNNFADFVAATVAYERLKASGWEAIPGLILPEGKQARDL